MSERQAAVELFFRLNHARQTVDFVKRQARPLLLVDFRLLFVAGTAVILPASLAATLACPCACSSADFCA